MGNQNAVTVYKTPSINLKNHITASRKRFRVDNALLLFNILLHPEFRVVTVKDFKVNPHS